MASNLEPKINRIATAVTSALSALTAKGVTVPEGANVESLAALIESIQAGSGGFENIQTVSGSFTPESLINTETQMYPSIKAFTVEHNAGFVPRAVIAYTGQYGSSQLTLYVAVVNGLYLDNGYTVLTYSVHQYYSNKKYINNDCIRTAPNTWSDSVFTIAHSNNSIMLSGGTTVNWVVFS